MIRVLITFRVAEQQAPIEGYVERQVLDVGRQMIPVHLADPSNYPAKWVNFAAVHEIRDLS